MYAIINGKCGISLILILFTLVALPAIAQDCDKTYQSGITLMGKRTVASVKEAIAQFEAAKRCYRVNRETEGAQRCDEQIAACEKIIRYSAKKRSIKTSEESINIDAKGGTVAHPIKTSYKWKYSEPTDWCKATKKDKSLEFVIEPNTTLESRTQTITIEWSGQKEVLTITQKGEIEELLTLSETTVFFKSNDSTKEIKIDTNCEWAVEAFEDTSWYDLRLDASHIYITPERNIKKEIKKGRLRVKTQSKQVEVQMTQEADNFSVFIPSGNDTLVFIPKGGIVELPVEYTVNASETLWSVESYPNWCTTENKDNTFLSLKCLPNKTTEDRSSNILVKNDGHVYTFTIIQYGTKTKYNTSRFKSIFSNNKEGRQELYQRAILY